MKLNKLLLIISIVVMAVGVGLFIAAIVLSFLDKELLTDIFLGVASVLGVASLGLLIYNLSTSVKTVEPYAPEQPKVVVKVVDVKDLPKTKEEKLFEQYENLFKQGLISKEDLELKRKELLGK